MTLPAYLWGAGAESVGQHFPRLDRLRCSNCRRWTRSPAFYPLGRRLCPSCHAPLVAKAKTWAEAHQPDQNDRSRP